MAAVVLSVPQRADADSSAGKAEYTMEKDKIEYRDAEGTVRGIVSFQYPQFKGDSAAVEKINAGLKKKSRKFLHSGDADRLREYTQDAMKNGLFDDENTCYFWETSCSEKYNKDGIVSFNMHESWFAGGVYNYGDYGLNYDLGSGKKLTVKDVISGRARKRILKAAKKYCGSDKNAYDIIKNTGTKDFKFFFDEEKVSICFESYELGRGPGWDIIIVGR